MRRLGLSIFILFSCLSAQAEYRVFRLLISPAGREVISTLDPDQYRGYYHVNPTDVITYTETWMCKENTGHFQETCPAPSRAPASQPGEVPAPSTSSAPP